jgi:hypothetical protein
MRNLIIFDSFDYEDMGYRKGDIVKVGQLFSFTISNPCQFLVRAPTLLALTIYFYNNDAKQMNVLINHKPVDALAAILHRGQAEVVGREWARKLRDVIPK